MLYQQKHCLLGLKGVAAEQDGKAVGLPKLFKQDAATANICYPSRKSNNDSKDAAPESCTETYGVSEAEH